MEQKHAQLRSLPAVERVLNEPVLLDLAEQCPRVLLVEAAQQAVADLRAEILADSTTPLPDLCAAAIARRAAGLAQERMAPSLRPVINATGTLLHTNLGRAPLSAEALAAIEGVSRSYSNLEFDLETRRARPPQRPCRRAAVPADRGRSGDRGQQQRRRGAAGAGRPGRGERGDRLPRRTGRDRRLLPHPRGDGRRRSPPARGRHHQQDPPLRLPCRPRRRDRVCSSRSTPATTGLSASPRQSPAPSWRPWVGRRACRSWRISAAACSSTFRPSACRASRR